MNGYLFSELGVKSTAPLSETASTIHALFLQAVSDDVEESVANQPSFGQSPAATPAQDTDEAEVSAKQNTLVSTSSSVGEPLTSMTAAVASFISSVVAIEKLPLSQEQERAARARFLQKRGTSGLPEACSGLSRALVDLNSVLTTLLADESVLPARQPQRSTRLECQQFVHSCNAKLRSAKQRIEDALNELTGAQSDSEPEASGDDPDDTDEDDAESAIKEALYGECEELYAGMIEPRVAVAELVLAARVALTLRTVEVVSYASSKHVEIAGANENGDVIKALPGTVAGLLGSIQTMQEVFTVATESRSGQRSAEDGKRQIAAAVDDLIGHGLQDAEKWTAEYIFPRYFPSVAGPAVVSAASRTLGRSTSGIGFGKRSLSGTSSGILGPAHPSAPEDQDDIFGWVEYIDAVGDDANALFDGLGRVNMWLRRSGLAHEVSVDQVRGKVLPTTGDTANVYLPHTVSEGLWPQEFSDRYEHACIRYKQLVERREVAGEMEEALTLPDDQFVRACHDDLLEALFSRADEACFDGDIRRKLDRRLKQSLQMRIKVFHHDGDIRAVTLSQTSTLEEVITAMAEWMPDLPTCRLSYLDEGDKVSLATNREFAEVVRHARAASIAAGGAGGLGQSANLARSVTTIGSGSAGGDVRLELYVDPPARRSDAKSKPRAAALPPPPSSAEVSHRRFGVPSPPAPVPQPIADDPEMREAMRMLERRAQFISSQQQQDPTASQPRVRTSSQPSYQVTSQASHPAPPREPQPSHEASPRPSTLRNSSLTVDRPTAKLTQQPPAHDPSHWTIPQGLGSFSLAQHTVVGDEDDERRIEKRANGETLRETKSASSRGTAPANISRAAVLRMNRGRR